MKDSLLIDAICVEKNIEFYLRRVNSDEIVNDLWRKLNLINKKDVMVKMLFVLVALFVEVFYLKK